MSPIDRTSVSQDLERALSRSEPGYDDALGAVARAFGAVSATLHRADRETKSLHMVAHLGLPPFLLKVTEHIPFGKGIAGLCAERREAVTLCNLQTDSSGTSKPDAKQTGVAGAISVPVLAPDGALVGTLGIGKPHEHTYSEEEQAILNGFADQIGRRLSA